MQQFITPRIAVKLITGRNAVELVTARIAAQLITARITVKRFTVKFITVLNTTRGQSALLCDSHKEL